MELSVHSPSESDLPSEEDSDELRQTLRKLQRGQSDSMTGIYVGSDRLIVGPLLTGPLDELEAARALYEQSDDKCYELFVNMLGDGMAAEMM